MLDDQNIDWDSLTDDMYQILFHYIIHITSVY